MTDGAVPPPSTTDPAAPAGRWSCPSHGTTQALWKPLVPTYDAFVEHLATAGGFPTYLPWPLSPGWAVSDFAVVGDPPSRARATMTCSSGMSELDGLVHLAVVAEEAGTGLGGRCAGIRYDDPGHEIGGRSPEAKVRIESQSVNLWLVSTSHADGRFDRTVLAGEADGRWLWIVLRPASALLLVGEDLMLRDVSRVGPTLVEVPFGGVRPEW